MTLNFIDRKLGDVFFAISREVLLKVYAQLTDGIVLCIDFAASGLDVTGATVVEQPGVRR
ncbi:MAG: hypothetical protein JWO42_4073 [Chloroflexi bacterium]|nr:hypothetical protein [Chloroflexota bacterium]